MSSEPGNADPLDFMRKLWGQMGFALPGMVTPTLDLDELERRIKDLKAVEGWLRMNLNMMQMTIQGLEVQHSTLVAVRAISQSARDAAAAASSHAGATPEPGIDPEAIAKAAFNPAAMWPWNLAMGTPKAEDAPAPEAETPKTESTRARKPRKP